MSVKADLQRKQMLMRCARSKRLLIIVVTSTVAVVSGFAVAVIDELPVCTIRFAHFTPRATIDGAGGAVVTWIDIRDSSDVYDIYAQRIGENGALLWAAEGVEVTGAADSQVDPQITFGYAGATYVVWEDERSGSNVDVYAQRLDSNGERIWSRDGIPVSVMPGDQADIDVTTDGRGGVLIVWVDHRSSGSGADVYAQRINAAGESLWDTNGVAVCTALTDQNRPNITAHGNGGGIVVWEDKRNGDWDIYAQRIDADGTPTWIADGVPICDESDHQRAPQSISDFVGGAVITWDDRRGGAGDIYAQCVDSTGVTVWTSNGVAVMVDPETQVRPQITADGASGAIICAPGNRDDGSIYANRITAAGTVLWGVGGAPICLSGDCDWPKITEDGSGGAVIIWEDDRATQYEPDIYGQRVDADGNVLWTTDGVAICTAIKDQLHADIVPYGDGGLIAVWEDWRDGGMIAGRYRIYGQLVDADGNVGAATGVRSGATRIPPLIVLQNSPNPFSDHTTLRIELQVPATVRVDVYNVLGRRIRGRVIPDLPQGVHEIGLESTGRNNKRLPSGVYYCRVTVKDYSVVRKLTVIH
jgi:hypothetical protein